MSGFRVICVLLLCVAQLRSAAQMIPIDSAGYRLKLFYTSLGVREKWQKGYDIDWRTGIATSNSVTNKRTYCTRFVAAACQRLEIETLYPLHPSSTFGANTLFDWLQTRAAQKAGWKLVEGDSVLDIYCRAQQYANSGRVVMAIYQDRTGHPGHSALVMPSQVSCAQVQEVGPILIQAGSYNSDSTTLARGFRKRISSWPDEHILVYYNGAIPFRKLE